MRDRRIFDIIELMWESAIELQTKPSLMHFKDIECKSY